jgi:hypothetical protein
MGKRVSKLGAPLVDSYVGYDNAMFQRRLFDVMIAQVGVAVASHAGANNFRGKTLAQVLVGSGCLTLSTGIPGCP